jgi:phosphoglycolate phosphatase-like HAD superfamily hydrolase
VKLVLFDVDGTLLSARGAGRRALEQALVEVFGTAGPIDDYDFHGSTDLQIVRDLLTLGGVPAVTIAAGEARLFDRYAARLAAEVGAGAGVILHRGVARLVETLAGLDRCLVGLLTGNVESGARIKLTPTGLWPRFRVGAYGSDAEDRRRLPAVAAARAEALAGRRFRGDDLVIIGDTPRDIDCARAFGAAVIAVATGRHSLADLEAHAPDHLFADLGDTTGVIAAILGEPAPA